LGYLKLFCVSCWR